MVKLRCQDCGGVEEGDESDVEGSLCAEEGCDGDYAILNSDDDTYEDKVNCLICHKPNNENYSCEKCNQNNFCDVCTVQICKHCLKEEDTIIVCNDCLSEIRNKQKEDYLHEGKNKKENIQKSTKVDYNQSKKTHTSFDPFAKSKFD